MSINIFNPFISSNDVYNDLDRVEEVKEKVEIAKRVFGSKTNTKKATRARLGLCSGSTTSAQPQVCLAMLPLARRSELVIRSLWRTISSCQDWTSQFIM